MQPDSLFALPVSSFEYPVPVLSMEPDSAPLETIQVNSSWLAYLRGAAKQLLLQTTWDTSDPNVLALAQQRASNLIDLLKDTIVGNVPVGTVAMFGSNTPPDGWLLCNGNAVSKSVFAALYSVIGITFGGTSGGSTFNLPNLTARVPVGSDMGHTPSTHVLAATGGEESHLLTTAEMPSHHHTLHIGQNTSGMVALSQQAIWANTMDTTDVGGGAAHNNMQPFINMCFIIKAL